MATNPNGEEYLKAKRHQLIEVGITREAADKILQRWFGDKADPTQIPAAVIPELVEHLMLDAIDGTGYYAGGHQLFCEETVGRLRDAITAALEAFNQRKPK